MTISSYQRILVAYSGILTLAFAVFIFSGAKRDKTARFDEITVERINIVEADGTHRIVMSNAERFQLAPLKNKMYPHPNRNSGGIFFMDAEGTEIGGLIYHGKTDKDGKISSGGQLSFDRYNDDQVTTIGVQENNGKTRSYVNFKQRTGDRKEHIIQVVERIGALPKTEHKAAWDTWSKENPTATRVLLSMTQDESAFLSLKDPQGRERLKLNVDEEGNPSIVMFDKDGNEIERIPKKK